MLKRICHSFCNCIIAGNFEDVKYHNNIVVPDDKTNGNVSYTFPDGKKYHLII